LRHYGEQELLLCISASTTSMVAEFCFVEEKPGLQFFENCIIVTEFAAVLDKT